MGSILTRSSADRSDGTKSKWRRGKRKRTLKEETVTEGDKFLIRNNHEPENTNGNLNDAHEKWDTRIDKHELSNFNVDPPGAPSTYSNNYPMDHNEIRERTWPSPQDVDNHFYQNNSFPTATVSNVAYDPNQYVHNQIPNTFNNQSQQGFLEERPSKKVQFARPIQQQGASKNPLAGAQSWHESTITSNEIPGTIIRQEPVLNRQSVHRSVIPLSNSSSAQVSVQKPIYVGIDHKATLAERGQTTTQKHHHKNNDRSNSDGLVSLKNNQRTRSHAHHQHKHQDENDLVPSKSHTQSNKPLEPLQVKLSGGHRPTTTTSTSTIIANKQVQHADQPLFNNIEMKVPKTRGNRQVQAQQIEQQTLVENEIKPSRNKGNHTQQRQQQQPQQRTIVSRHHSPQRTEIIRRSDNKNQGTPTMRIPVSQQQQRQKQSTMLSTMISTPPITRTRV